MEAKEVLDKLQAGQEDLAEELTDELDKFKEFSGTVMEEGSLSTKQKALIGLGAAVAKQCEYCIVKNLKDAIEAGVSKEEVAETCSVIMLLNGGPGVAYSSYAIKKYEELVNE